MAVQPDFVIANKEENTREQVEALQQLVPVYTSAISTLNDALHMIGDTGKLVGRDVASTALITNIQTAFAALEQKVQMVTPPEQQRNSTLQSKAAYLIWKDPWMAAGGDTFIHDMLERCGCTNVFSNTARYPETTVQEMAALGCNFVLLSSEPYPFKQKHSDALQQQMPGTKIILVDGEMFSWYGSRLQYAAEYFMQLRDTLLSNQLH
jgi:ABC-type Fe3+-hydroxamate transport system substrate-binding protein